MDPKNENLNDILIAAITPQFLGKPRFWFVENKAKIISSTKSQTWWQDNILHLEKGQRVSSSEILRKFDEMRYEKEQTVAEPGEFATRGGVIDIFPINENCAVRITLWGSNIEAISRIEHSKTEETEEALKKRLMKKMKFRKELSELERLKIGDYVVHLDHGIGRYRGITLTYESPAGQSQE